MTQAVIPFPDVVSDDRPWVYEDGELTVYRASSIGACLKGLVAARRGYSRTPMRQYIQDIAKEGELHEGTIISRLEDMYDFTARHTGADQIGLELQVGPGLIIRVHPDGIAYGRSGTTRVAVIEAKSMSKDVFATFHRKKFDAEPRYQWQTAVEMHATGLPLVFGYKDRNSGRIEHFRIEDSLVTLTDLKSRVARVEALARKEDLEIVDIPCDQPSLLCLSYAYLHGGESKVAGDLPPDFDITRLDLLAETYDRARERVKIAKAARDDARKLIIGLLVGKSDEVAGMSKEELQEFLIPLLESAPRVTTPRFDSYIGKTTRTFLDKDALEEKVGDLTPFYVKKEIPQLRVTAVKE